MTPVPSPMTMRRECRSPDLAARSPRELALNLSEYHRNAAIRNSDYRPDHCYLVPENWGRVFELAGFQDFQILPDLAAVEPVLPSRYAGVVTAVRPA